VFSLDELSAEIDTALEAERLAEAGKSPIGGSSNELVMPTESENLPEK